MVNFTILAGGFSSFIATYIFDPDSATLSLIKQSDITPGVNPSWLALNQQNSSILYAVNEISPVGNLQSFFVDFQGGLTLVDNVTTGGNGPTFSNQLSTGEVTGINFGSPNISFSKLDPADPLRFQKDSSVVVAFPIPEAAPSNPHMSLEFNGEILVPDLGGDKIWRIVRNATTDSFQVQGQINIDAGAGPRHIAVQDNILFTVHEKTSTLTAQHIPEAPNGTTLPLLANVSVIPADPLPGTNFAAAEILISTPTERFPEPLIYVSNRNIGETIDPNGDTIAIFQFVNGTGSTTVKRMLKRHSRTFERRAGESLQLLAQIPTGLQQIRSMTIGNVKDGGDEFIIAGANTQGGVAVFRRVDGGRNLTLVTRNEEIANRTSFVFI